MKSFAKYISKNLASFAGFIILLLLLNTLAFGTIFYQSMNDLGDTAPRKMLEEVAAVATTDGLPDDLAQKLENNEIWAMLLNEVGEQLWAMYTPNDIPTSYSIKDVAVFSRGYLQDYPVFVWSSDYGLLVLGYPKGSFMKIIYNYLPESGLRVLPSYITGMLIFDLALLFLAYHLSKHKILKNTKPIISAVETLADGETIELTLQGELSDVADSVNRASKIIGRQNEARANWISGISHDIRTPLSMIMGYAGRIACDNTVSLRVREEVEIISRQSIKIKELVQDLNLVSQLEYEMQPLNKSPLRLSALIRSYAADLLNSGIPDCCTISVEIPPAAEPLEIEGDARLISRAINNLVQNSIQHNTEGCDIIIGLDCTETAISLFVSDNGIGLTSEKMKELENRPHYMESTDERLDLRHGLGLVLVRQIAGAHNGTLKIMNNSTKGLCTTLTFPRTDL